jgi:hypothetical protein
MKGIENALTMLSEQYPELVERDSEKVKTLFEETFHHNEFTGRSGTFFAYEGLGSIYWHMVSKLLLAVQETTLRTRNEPSAAALIETYVDIRKGLGFNKMVDVYGAFPTDPYSHTPKGQGAKQPGMTGMVKEEILTRQIELGYSIENGKIAFDFLLLDTRELLSAPAIFEYWNVDGQKQNIECPVNTVAYSICQVPVILQQSSKSGIEVHRFDGAVQKCKELALDVENSQHIFKRDGKVICLSIFVTEPKLVAREEIQRNSHFD